MMRPEHEAPGPPPDETTIDYAQMLTAAQQESPSEAPTSEEQRRLLFTGGVGHSQQENNAVAERFEDPSHTAIPAPPDINIKAAPKGYRVVSSDTEKGSRIMARRLAYLETAKPDTVFISSLQQEARADELIHHIEQQGVGPITHYAQSADAQNAVIAAYKRPDLFDNVVLLFPSAQVKKQNRTEYLRQAVNGFRRRGQKIQPPAELPQASVSSPPTTFMERFRARLDKKKQYKASGGYTVAASAIAAYNSALLSSMRQKDQAPGVGLVLGLQDKMMKPDRILESLLSASDIDYALITTTGHGLGHGSNKDQAVEAEISKLTDLLDARNAERRAAQARGEIFEPGPLSERLIFMPDVPQHERDRLRAIADQVPQHPPTIQPISFE